MTGWQALDRSQGSTDEGGMERSRRVRVDDPARILR